MQPEVIPQYVNPAPNMPVEGMTPVESIEPQPKQSTTLTEKALTSGETAYTGWGTIPFVEKGFVQQSLEICFRIGFALVFIINSATAIIEPEGFRKLIESNFLLRTIGHTQIMIYIIAANDALLGLLILFGWKKKWVFAWAGLWLFIVTFMKFTTLL